MLSKLVWVLCLSTAWVQAAEYESKADQLLGVTGVQGGLVVHLGCGEGT